MPTYPTSPPANRIEDAGQSIPAISAEFGRIIRHVRERHKPILRRVRLVYQHRTLAEFTVLQTFFDAQKGRAQRFDFTDPDEGTTYKARLTSNKLAWKITNGARYTVVMEIEEAP